jgi:hypothetical protein
VTHSNTPNATVPRWQPATLGIMAILCIWALSPEIRRLVDWRAGFSLVSIFSVLPLLALLAPLVALIYGGGLARVDRRLAAIAWIWFGGFTSALAVAVVSGTEISAALYSYATFCLPAVFGLWVASLETERSLLFERVARFLLMLAAPLALYAIAQLAYPPPWDVAWMLQARLPSMGPPLPFQFRPFSTLNGPAVFADFLVAVILLNLPRLRNASPVLLLQVGLCGGALALTMVRSGWLGLTVGVACFLALGSNRLANLTALAFAALAFYGVTNALPNFIGASNVGGGLGARLSSLSQLDSDASYVDRERYLGEPLREAAATPQGSGLGIIGNATKLGSTGAAEYLDNGYIARLTEMGWFGTACYLVAGLGALVYVLSQRGAVPAAVIGAAAAIQVDLMTLDLSGDSRSSLGGMVFWLSLALVSRRVSLP